MVLLSKETVYSVLSVLSKKSAEIGAPIIGFTIAELAEFS